MSSGRVLRAGSRLLVLGALAAFFATGCGYALGTPFTWKGWLPVAVFAVAVLITVQLSGAAKFFLPVILVLGLGAGLVYALDGDTGAAWVALGVFFVMLLWYDGFWVGANRLPRWGARLFLAGIAGAAPVALVQIEGRFADEEFFVALQAVILGTFWLLLSMMPVRCPAPAAGRRSARRWGGLLLLAAALVGTGGVIFAYQRSFYPALAPSYPGISAISPFLCGETAPDPQTYEGEQTFRRLGERAQARSHREPPEYGLLALAGGDEAWAQRFRQALLAEARQGRFTAAAHSIKYGQFEASSRVYYFSLVQRAFPTLFTQEEQALLRDWFSAINRRAFTVEGVDWMYALALAQWPSGPYENQENGAGLLAVLEYTGLADARLSPKNRAYLDRTPRGWQARFRNTDDALIYQRDWLQNAYLQSLYTGQVSEGNLRLSFEWLLLQALPDGAPLGYNHPAALSLASLAYAGARLLHDPRYVWLSGRALDYLEQHGKGVAAQPGAEEAIPLTGVSPTQGSCLLYGDSGLPNQIGPLAPDKIVFREGWTSGSAYLLLNLRFTGWHRYKATNTVSLVYQDGPLVADELHGQRFRWLPAGRRLFRDKRIPRENLNGLLVERSGLNAVLHTLAGAGGPWFQDPPYYARVCSFTTEQGRDTAHTRLEDWHGWQHDRWIYFYQGGPIFVFDEASGPPHSRSAIVWHPTAGADRGERRVLLQGGTQAEMVLLPVDTEAGAIRMQKSGDTVTSVEYVRQMGQLRLVTIFLPDRWAGATVEYDSTDRTVQIRGEPGELVIPLPDASSCQPQDSLPSG